MTSAMTAATSSTGCACGKVRESGPPWSAFLPKSVATTPGRTELTWMSGYWARSSMRRLAVSELSACFAAL